MEGAEVQLGASWAGRRVASEGQESLPLGLTSPSTPRSSRFAPGGNSLERAISSYTSL